MREQRVPLELLDHRCHAVVPPDTQVVTLRDVVGEHHPRPGAQPRQDRQQHIAFEGLRLVDDHERVVQRRPRMWVSGNTSNIPLAMTSSIT